VYNLLGYVCLATGENLGAGVNAVKKAIAIAPGREDYAMKLGQLYLRQQSLAEARQVLEPLARDASRPEIRSRAESLLETIARIEQFKAQGNTVTFMETPPSKSGETVAEPTKDGGAVTEPTKDGALITPPTVTLRRRIEGEKVEGLLTRVDCNK